MYDMKYKITDGEMEYVNRALGMMTWQPMY